MNEVHLPTISGASQVMSMDITAENTKKVFRAVCNQTEALVPIVSREINGVGNYELSRLAAGFFMFAFDVGSFAVEDAYVTAKNNSATSGEVRQATAVLFEDTIQLNIFNNVGVAVDTFMNVCDVELTVYKDLSTDVLIFAEMLVALDAKQLLIWNKIVIRNGGEVTEVDGKKYRSTGDFSLSSSAINS